MLKNLKRFRRSRLKLIRFFLRSEVSRTQEKDQTAPKYYSSTEAKVGDRVLLRILEGNPPVYRTIETIVVIEVPLER